MSHRGRAEHPRHRGSQRRDVAAYDRTCSIAVGETTCASSSGRADPTDPQDHGI